MIVGITMQQPSSEAQPQHEPSSDQSGDLLDNDKAAAEHHAYEPQIPTQIEHAMNGSLPPQQVYVNPAIGMGHPGMTGLETQFQAIGFRQEEATASTEPSSTQTNPNENDGDDEGDEAEEEDDPVKLFVGQVPKSMNEEDIFPTFDSFGPLKDVAIIRDKHTGLHRGCAFVTYWSSADALAAQEALHDKVTFPGARRPAQVKPAEPSSSVPENKLFIGMLSRKAGEDEVRELFAPFGDIREIHMIRNSDGSSKCAAFLRFVNRESATQAIENLNNNFMMEGAQRPLIVKFADNKHQRQQRQMRNARRQEMMAAMGQGPGGYAPYPGVPPPMGMPHGHPGAGGQYPMAGPQYGAAGYGPGGQPPPPHAYMYPPHQYGPTPPSYGYQNQGRQEMGPTTGRPREGPAGANLFVYHLPHDLTDADLATAFNPFGNVVSAKVYVDRYTGESKGFGFVSYDSVLSAETAIEQMNGFQIGNKRLKVQHKRVHSHNVPASQKHPPQSAP